ncbi:polysaccharide biosynthesis tyrosine autokinase [Echinicola soli]|uniref:non-specific protein-tyrosine kinase n=1 Tax=Echinicola soli TaxID=2591634 RepID=A0A514CJT1_9BACT|nr:tyrosine-protein kinase family protein [Echinicola soli]QDH80095.1 polysaccharide biosynthesis tyrosine autokinase [Echinicola soli]
MSNNDFEYYTEGSNDTFDFKGLFSKYLRFWPIIVLSMVLFGTAAYFYNQTQPSEYKVSGKLLIEEDAQRGNILNLTNLPQEYSNSLINKMANDGHQLKSYNLANEVLNMMDFDVEYFEEETFKDQEIYQSAPVKVEVDWNHPQLTENKFKIEWKNSENFVLSYISPEYILETPSDGKLTPIEINTTPKAFPFNRWIETAHARIKVIPIETNTPGSIKVTLRNRKSLLAQYTGENLTIAPMDAMSSILNISLITTVPEKGSDYVNKLLETFLDNSLEEKNHQARKTVDFIDNQINGVSDTLSTIENRLQSFRSQNKTYNIGTEGSSIFQKITELESELNQENFKNEYYKNLQSYLSKEDYSDIILPSGIGIEDPILNKLIQDLILLQSERSQYLATQTASSPNVREVSKKIEDLNKSINEVLKNTISNSDRLVSSLQNRLYKLEGEFKKLPSTEQDLLRIQRSFTLNENIYTFLMQRRAEAAISMVSTTAPDKIMESAKPSYIPLPLKPLTNYIIGIALGFILPVLIISIFIFTNVNVKDRKELEAKLNNPVLTSVGHNRNKNNLVVLNKNKSSIAEAFRSLRTNLTFIVPKDEKITIAITSSIAGEGKSFTSINLASAYSIAEKKTILVGCDMHKPKLYNDFNVSNSVGLSTYLSKQVHDVNAVIQKSPYPNLDLMVAGPTPPNPAELLIGSQFEAMISELKEKYDVIIFDTPPIGLTSETLAVLKLVNVTLCVIRHNYSNYGFIEDINSLKDKKGFRNIYTVFNDVPSRELNYGGYGYGYYSDDKNKSSMINKILKGGSGRAAV